MLLDDGDLSQTLLSAVCWWTVYLHAQRAAPLVCLWHECHACQGGSHVGFVAMNAVWYLDKGLRAPLGVP
jgi:hypothetical protein